MVVGRHVKGKEQRLTGGYLRERSLEFKKLSGDKILGGIFAYVITRDAQSRAFYQGNILWTPSNISAMRTQRINLQIGTMPVQRSKRRTRDASTKNQAVYSRLAYRGCQPSADK